MKINAIVVDLWAAELQKKKTLRYHKTRWKSIPIRQQYQQFICDSTGSSNIKLYHSN